MNSSHTKIPNSDEYSFCESSTGNGRWHIRKLDTTGKHLTGGITTTSLCGTVLPIRNGGLGGWDLDVDITDHHLSHTCTQCKDKFNEDQN